MEEGGCQCKGTLRPLSHERRRIQGQGGHLEGRQNGGVEFEPGWEKKRVWRGQGGGGSGLL